ncbi:hypothetical protein [Plasmodium yoelii yoelii]|uniref:Uncharacterized protein n=1 Tax=Plasmodium yoelii yoelii TaxID=73239 RepID=Q7RPI8_PLAYO|nr:hypothetical protein [Plasmodium yoelii yoelii]
MTMARLKLQMKKYMRMHIHTFTHMSPCSILINKSVYIYIYIYITQKKIEEKSENGRHNGIVNNNDINKFHNNLNSFQHNELLHI